MNQLLDIDSDRRVPRQDVPEFASRGLVPLSVVIAGTNPERLERTLSACIRYSGQCPIDLIVVHEDRFSNSGVPRVEIAPNANASWRWLPAERGVDARFLGAYVSKYNHLLFLDEGLQPQTERLFQHHASLHSARPEKNFCVLGDVIDAGKLLSGVALSIGSCLHNSGEMAGGRLAARRFLDWRYFTWSNVSIKKSLVRDWLTEAIRVGSPGAVSAIEFAYSLSRRLSRPLRIFYEPRALAFRPEMERLAGLMGSRIAEGIRLRNMLDRHVGAAEIFGLRPFIEPDALPPGADTEFIEIIEGIKAWARLAENRAEQEGVMWRQDFAAAVLELCFLQGLATANGRAMAQQTGSLILERFRRRYRNSVLNRFSGSHA